MGREAIFLQAVLFHPYKVEACRKMTLFPSAKKVAATSGLTRTGYAVAVTSWLLLLGLLCGDRLPALQVSA